MSVNDPIADMLTRIRNGVMASHPWWPSPIQKSRQKLPEF